MAIGPHRDLPTITEDILESEEEQEDEENSSSSVSGSRISIDDNQSDSGSSKISYSANSYAFTLDGVGFDEENSLISGICNGSVLNHTNSATTPSPQKNDSNSQRHYTEKELHQQHRDACRNIGIPWSSANSDSDCSGCSDATHGDTTTANTALSNKRKVKWPSLWSDTTGKLFSIAATPPTLDTLDEHMRNYALDNTDGAKKKKRRKIDHGSSSSRWNGSALIASVVLVAICIIGIVAATLTSKRDQGSIEAEVVVMEGLHPRPTAVDVHGGFNGSAETEAANNSKAAYDASTADCITNVCNHKLSHTCLLKYKVNPPSSVTPVNTISFELICEGESWIGLGFSNDGHMIGSEAVLGVPGEIPQKYVLGGKDNTSVVPMAAHKQTLMDSSIHVSRRGLTIMRFTKIMSEDGEVEIKPGGENTFLYAQGVGMELGHHAMGESFTLTLPSFEETESPQHTVVTPTDTETDAQDVSTATVAETETSDAATPTSTTEEPIVADDTTSKEATADDLDSSCVDQPGKFITRKGKYRSCDWMSKSGDTLHSNLHDRECGSEALNTQPSELGSKCRYTCRAYNGCLVNDTQDVSIEDIPPPSMEVFEVQPPPMEVVENVQPPPIEVIENVQPPPIEVLQVVDAEGAAGVAAPCTIDVCNLELSHTCLLKYKVNTPTSVTPVNTISFELICEGETWIGIGFSNDGQMIGSDAVLGVPGGTPQKYVLGGKGSSSVVPMAAHKQTLMDASVEYESGLTILKFTKIMSEDGEIEIKPGGENTFLYAQGMGVDLGYHVTGESFTLSLPDLNVGAAAVSMDSSTHATLAEGTFIDATKGLIRSCSWLDILDWERRQKRRDAHCHNELTLVSCPTSCSAYSFVNQFQSGQEPHDMIESILNNQDIKLMHAHVPLPRDDCFDSDGFYLDSNSTLRQCDWLNTNPDPLDETRKIYNCGYMNEPTDLGRMCKLSCGMCDW